MTAESLKRLQTKLLQKRMRRTREVPVLVVPQGTRTTTPLESKKCASVPQSYLKEEENLASAYLKKKKCTYSKANPYIFLKSALTITVPKCPSRLSTKDLKYPTVLNYLKSNYKNRKNEETNKAKKNETKQEHIYTKLINQFKFIYSISLIDYI